MSKEYDEKTATGIDLESFSHDVSIAEQESLDEELVVQKEILEDEGSAIKYRNCSWQKTSMLLATEYICLAAMSFPWSFSVLGLIPGLILTLGIAATTIYTGTIIGDYCLKYPKMQNICDIGQHLFWGKKWAYWATAVCFILNNSMIQALHVLVGAKYLNTLSDHGTCTIAFSVITTFVCFIFALPRTFHNMSYLSLFAAATMFIAMVLCIVFAGIQEHPDEWDPTVPIEWNLWPAQGTTYVDGMNAMLNILFTLAGQITYPSFIAEMRNPKDFRKALYLVGAFEIILYCIAGSVIYVMVGNNYIASPAFGVLSRKWKFISFSLTIPTIIILGSLFGNITCQFIFFKIFDSKSAHRRSHTTKGWGIWIFITIASWILAFIIAQVIPFFGDLLSLMSSLFACWFGYVFWGVAYMRLKQAKYKGQYNSFKELYFLLTGKEKLQYWVSWFIIAIGVYLIGPGTYSAVESIRLNYAARLYGDVFTCANNGI